MCSFLVCLFVCLFMCVCVLVANHFGVFLFFCSFFFFCRCVCVECVCFGFACVFSFRMFLSFPFVCMCACVRTTVRRYLSPILLGDGMYMTETFRWLILTHTEDLYTRTLDSKFQFKVVLRSMASPPYSQRCRIVRCLFLCFFLFDSSFDFFFFVC